MATYLVLLAIGLPWLGGLIVWWIGDKYAAIQHKLASAFSVAGGLAALVLLFFTGNLPVVSISMGSVFGEFTLIPDGLGVLLTVIAAVVGSLAVIFSNDYMKGQAQIGRYYALTLLFIGAMVGLVLSGSLLFMFLFWEITAFCSYALISFHNDDPKAVAGGIKALIITQIGGVGLLVGAIISYIYLDSYQINDFLGRAQSLPANLLTIVAFGYLIAAAAKSAQIPFHTWLPDAMEAPTPISALIHAATMVNAGVYLLARFYPAFEGVTNWKQGVMIVGLLSALLAAVIAVVTNDLKRTLAYSTISQLGYMVYAIGVGAVFSSQFHLLSHALFKALLFLGAGAVIHSIETRDMQQMGGLAKQMPYVRTVFVIGALALAGLPITNGFFSKELVLEGGLIVGPFWAYAGMLIGASITGLYTLRMVSLVFWDKPRGSQRAHDAAPAMRISLTLLALGTLTTWLLAGPLSYMLAESLPFHQLHTESTYQIVVEILSAGSTWITLVLISLGMVAWWWRDRFLFLTHPLRPLLGFVEDGFGFEWINRQLIQLTLRTASAVRLTQTGLLGWNIFGIVGGLIFILAIIIWVT